MMRFAFAAVVLGTCLVLPGCGGGSVSDHDLPAGTNAPTTIENVRSWLEGVAQNGELDSGITLMHEEAEKLQAEGVASADEIAAGLKELESAKGSSAIKSKAKSLLSKLPAE